MVLVSPISFLAIMFEGHLTAERYRNIFQNKIPELLEDVPLAIWNEIYFQQDGIPAHNTQIFNMFLEEQFPRCWIRKHVPCDKN